jgi:hypothetical protein
MKSERSLVRMAGASGAIYLAGGLWALSSMRTFEWVFGPKVDKWLVRTVALLLTTVGTAATLAARRRRVTPEIAVVCAGTATSLGLIDVVYASSGRISKRYLLDALVELGMVGGWLAAWRGARAGA